jgi:predicted enzyme related to lactoylglutathione lyase
MKPKFEPGKNIAIKVPPHQFENTVLFYRDVLGLEELDLSPSEQYESVTFKFGDKNLWIDKISSISHAEIWLEIKTDDIEQAAHHFKDYKVVRRDEIEPLPSDFKGFWISSPSNIIHLINE